MSEKYAWETHDVWPWSPVTIRGKKVWFGSVMRRALPDGSFEYRELTDEESRDHIAESSF